MRLSLFAFAAAALFLGACTETPNTTTVTTRPQAPAPQVGSTTTASGKIRIALLLPLSGRAAPTGQAMQQAAEMSLFDSGAKDIALAAYDAGESPNSAIEAYRKARADGAALVLGPLFGSSASALAPLVQQGGANVIAFSNDEQAARPGVWVMGVAAPPQVRRVVDYAVESGIKRFAVFAPRTTYGQQMADALSQQAGVRGAQVVASEFFSEGADVSSSARRLATAVKGDGKLAILVPATPPNLSSALAALSSAGLDNASVKYIGTGSWDIPGIGADPNLRGAWYAAPDPANRADFERRYTTTYGRPPLRLATLAYDAVALAGRLARVKQGGDFSAEAITNASGWSGVDGVFRFQPDGRTERALAVIEIQGERNTVISPAPSSFRSFTN